jgi:hypothetical protein
MARIKYTGPVEPMRIPGVGPVGKEWVPCEEFIAREFAGIEGFETEIEEPEAKPLNPGTRTLNPKKNGGDEK